MQFLYKSDFLDFFSETIFFTFLCWIWVSQQYCDNFRKLNKRNGNLPPSYLPYTFLHSLHSFLDGFLKNSSFRIAMFVQVGIRWAGGRRPKFTFWLTFFQSYMLPLFFNGLLSYLVGMKRRTSKWFTCKRDNSYFLHYLKNLSKMPLGILLVTMGKKW